MPPTDRRRAVIDALKAIPAKHRAWLNEPVSIRGFELFCYHGWGVVLNDAQVEAVSDIFERETPENVGTFHLWRWANRTGKAQPLDEPVLTPRGWRPIGDLRVGDEVIAGDGSRTFVTGVFPQGIRQVYRVTTDDGAWTRCDGEHLWKVMTPGDRFNKEGRPRQWGDRRLPGHRGWSVLSASEVAERWGEHPKPTQRCAIPTAGRVSMRFQPVPVHPYLLGLLLGDGGLSGESVRFTTADPELAEALGARHISRYDYSVPGMMSAMRELGLAGKHSYDKAVPRAYMDNAADVRVDVLAGLMDTDGSVDASGHVEFSSTSRQLADDVAELVRSLGGRAKVVERQTFYTHLGQRRAGRPSWRVHIKAPGVPLFRLERKSKRLEAWRKRWAGDRLIYSIVPDGEAETVCISVEHPDQTYVTRGHIVTHNTTGLLLAHTYIAFKKWRYENADLDGWLGYRYKTLHAAPEGILMGKAWEMADSLVDGSSIVQRSALTNRQRPGIFVQSPMFKVTTLRDASAGGDQPVILVANGSRVDFLQTYAGASRMESDAWWFIVWDEWGEHKPIGNVPYLIDSTFLPRSSDFMAPVILSSTEKEHNAAIYMEIEDLAARDPDRWNVREFGREANFSQSRASMERQVRMSSDTATAQRSVRGGSAEFSSGSVLPRFTLERAFDVDLPAARTVADLGPPPQGRTWKIIQSFDHAIKGDRNVLLTVAVVWPILGREDLIHHRAQGLDLDVLSTNRVLTPEEVVAFAVRGHRKHGHPGSIWLTDTTGEGGIMYHRMLRAAGIPSREFNYTARVSKNDRRTKKGHGRTGLQRLFSLGLVVDEKGRIVMPDDPAETEFGGIALPYPDPLTGKEWRRMHRQLAMLQTEDDKLVQDHAMVVLQVAGFLYPYFERAARVEMIDANPFGRRLQRVRGIAITR